MEQVDRFKRNREDWEDAMNQQNHEVDVPIPRRLGRNYIQKYIDQLPRPSISSAHPEDYMCLICRTECETDAQEGDDKDLTVQLPCGHILGSSCIALWVPSKIEVMCPLCNEVFLPANLFDRTSDIRHYLFWQLRTVGYPAASELLHKMDLWNGYLPQREQQVFKKYIDGTFQWDGERTPASNARLKRLLDRAEKRRQWFEHRVSPQYQHTFKSEMARRDERDGVDVETYTQRSIIRVAAEYIMHGLHEIQLEIFGAAFCTLANLEAHSKVLEYGPDGLCEEYWLLPGVKLEHVGSIGHKKGSFPMER